MAWTRWWLAGAWSVCAILAAAPPPARFLSFREAQEVLTAFNRTEDASAWDVWIKTQDREVRARIDRGAEDSISNLVLYGTTFTRLPRMESAEAAVDAAGELVDAARARVRVAANTLARPVADERLRFARDFLLRRSVQPREMEGVLTANLTRFSLEQHGYQERLRSAGQDGDQQKARFLQATLFDRRGLSVDTSLLPNYALEDTLRAMLRTNAMVPGSVRSIAVIGPGLDFTDKRDGYDFFPLQTTSRSRLWNPWSG